jgi:octaprenyl-diphosphate synthase
MGSPFLAERTLVKPLAHTADLPDQPEVPAPVTADLARVEARLTQELDSREPRLGAIGRHLIDAGGKRVRPTVVLLVYHAAAGPELARRDDVIEVAVALELIHSATLLHDDIIDGGEVRRGKPSALRAFGLADTLVAGDFLFSRAFALCARFEAEVIRWAAEACVSLTEGEIMQGRFRHDPAVTVDDYLEIIERKTASLFTAGAKTAAHVAGAPPAIVDAMASCGRHVGLAFQTSDDLLDVAGHPAVTGKPRGIDLRDGNPSLPIVLALAIDPELRRLFTKRRLEPSELEQGLTRIRRSGVLAEVGAATTRHVDAALAEIARLPASPYRAMLETLAQGLGDRPT